MVRTDINLNLNAFLSKACVRWGVPAHSMKQVLQTIAKIVSSQSRGTPEVGIFDLLLAREQLGATALSHGVALPHARIPGIDQPLCVLLHLDTPVDYMAPDGLPVDLFFALLLPEDADDSHLKMLALIARHLRDENYREHCRDAGSDSNLYTVALP